MPGVDWGALAKIVPEVVLVLVFVWFVLERDKRQDSVEKDRHLAYLASEKDRDQDFRDFLTEERKARYEAMARLAEEIKTLATLMVANNALLTQHDVFTKTLLAPIRRKRQ